jgi:hypothetical protein
LAFIETVDEGVGLLAEGRAKPMPQMDFKGFRQGGRRVQKEQGKKQHAQAFHMFTSDRHDFRATSLENRFQMPQYLPRNHPVVNR